MKFPFNRGQVADAIAQFFGLKGEFSFELSNETTPTIQISSLDDSPYLLYAIPVLRFGTAAAVAAEFGAVVARPGLNQMLQVNSLDISNATAGALNYSVGMMTVADLAASPSIVSQGQMYDVSRAGTNPVPARPSALWAGTRGAVVFAGLIDIWVPANSSRNIVFPKPGVILDGTPDTGGLVVWCRTVNTVCSVSVYGREWPRPG